MEKLKMYYEKYIKVFLMIILIGLFAHSFIITNKLINHDDLGLFFSKGATYNMGRW